MGCVARVLFNLKPLSVSLRSRVPLFTRANNELRSTQKPAALVNIIFWMRMDTCQCVLFLLSDGISW